MKVVSSLRVAFTKGFVFGINTMLFANRLAAQAQQPATIARIGFVSTTSPSNVPARLEAFRQGLRKLGYVEGRNIVIEYRYAEGKVDRLPSLADELVHRKVDVIVTSGPSPTRAANKATVTIPIVMTWDYDPLGNGYVTSLARPGGNITGLSILAPEISGKQLELLKEIVPTLGRVAVLGTSTVPGNAEALKATELAAEALKMQLQYLEVRDRKDIETALRTRARRVQRQSSRSRAASC
jgi:putative tryptophan/tyrosine transport system substrate-binding protein